MKRRNVIAKIGATGASLVAIGSVSGNSGRNRTTGRKVAGEFKTDFDPSNQEETEKFVLNTFKNSKEKGAQETQNISQSVSDELSQKQKRTVLQFLQKNARLKVTHKVQPDSRSSERARSEAVEKATTHPLLPSQAMNGGDR